MFKDLYAYVENQIDTDFVNYFFEQLENFAFQKEKTDTVAADMQNELFKLENGEILYRPGGHGALIENLNDLEEDIIFIKNIDNVSHRSQVQDTINSKKMLASIGMEVKQQIDCYINDLVTDKYDLAEINHFIKETLNITSKKK